ncbi:MAG: hypothetical protein GEU79_14545 [Acidimicrobiia bacterium]|nr:hypothetical protein [Acidimicrobiia bacterium]
MLRRTRRAAVSLWVGGFSALLFTSLRFTAVYEPDDSVFGFTAEEYDPWLILPIGLILYGLAALHRHQAPDYGRLGCIGFLTTVTGYSLILVGDAWSVVLFPPTHLFWFVGGTLSSLGLLVVIAGWALWGIASFRAKSLPTWAIPAPLVIALVWVTARFVLTDFLFDVFWMGDPGLIQAVNAIGLGVLGLALWRSENGLSKHAPRG